MNILITGGAGYIGSHVSYKLLESGHKVSIIDDLSNGYRYLIPKEASFYQKNINDINFINNLLQKNNFDILIHLAGYIKVKESIINPKKYYNNNTYNSEMLFVNCIKNGIKNIIFSSTAAVYGNTTKYKVSESDQLNPINPYGKSKALAEKILIDLRKKNKFNYMILRYFNVAGADPSLRCGLISKDSSHLIKLAAETAIGKKESITIFGNDYPTKDGTAIRDYIHVSDLANIHLESINYLVESNNSLIMNCGYGKGYSVKEVLDALKNNTKNNIKIKIGKKREGDAFSSISDISLLESKIKWKPQYNDINKIIKSSIDWETKLKNEKIF
ncbi:MAG: UDP-glucose 4-epimerase [Alphaproteobacteria bacterium MarineAlpha5_Bin9]|nr:MAG: UDP-glucose 4-epimerase [Alphaproteobacteria bacterium MarineAlpha5_Bin9]|tara:strand:+ start:4457 stop:5446 length:990 start_codon:yes stop_codon:yes gene_type:complete